jgi:lipopolysaccharide/colanic/teichoic acid biosynthesis glycosyltransferase
MKPPAGDRKILSANKFQLEIEKEIQRSNRRKTDPEFAIVSMDFCDHKVPDQKLNALIDVLQERLRVSDSVGWHELKLAVLLPETDREGASLVCDSLLQIAETQDVELKATYSVYPWDDRLLGPNQMQESEDEDFKGPSFWNGSSKSDFEESPSFDINDSSDGGGVAMMVAPKVKTIPVPRLSGGSGVRMKFSKSEKTPVWKRSVDLAAASVGLMLLSPVFAFVAIAIKLTSRGPVFFMQEREGKGGEVFRIVKFRTMCVDAESQKANLRKLSEQDGPAFKLKDDPRITGFGKYLRKSCIDELPQLFNVLGGSMSLVGPRPLPVDESLSCQPWQRQRLTVLPGVTCTWQARGGRDIKFSEWMRMDIEYIRQRGFWFDLKLIGETAFVAVMHKGSV